MRKFDVRWWSGPELLQWRSMTESGDCDLPFFLWPKITEPILIDDSWWISPRWMMPDWPLPPHLVTSQTMTKEEYRRRYPSRAV